MMRSAEHYQTTRISATLRAGLRHWRITGCNTPIDSSTDICAFPPGGDRQYIVGVELD